MPRTSTVVRLTGNYQVSVPKALRDQLGLKLGDFLDTSIEDSAVVLRPKVLLDPGALAAARARRGIGVSRAYDLYRRGSRTTSGHAQCPALRQGARNRSRLLSARYTRRRSNTCRRIEAICNLPHLVQKTRHVKLPNGQHAELGAKLNDYVLNPLHREGKHKARMFDSVLGATLANADVLRLALLNHAANSDRAEWRGDYEFVKKSTSGLGPQTSGSGILGLC